jgi:uncharacterized protein with NAD-binding domain and iron-sulfur cluster
MRENETVCVIGGGTGGLSAAHELAERGFEVGVYESKERFGGKARSIYHNSEVTGTELPGEHGFRFFPEFYSHVTDTMKRIPYGGKPRGVYDNLVVPPSGTMMVEDGKNVAQGEGLPRTPEGFRRRIRSLFWTDEVPRREFAFFVDRMMTLATSCEKRWEEYEKIPWWEFIEAERMSEEYRKFLGRGVTKILVAMDPEESSTRTIGKVALRTAVDVLDPRRDAVRILDGPTSERWIEPWVKHLDGMGVALENRTSLERLSVDGDVEVEKAEFGTDSGSISVEADHYVLAVPVEVAREVIPDGAAREETGLGGLDSVETDWMNGIQFYLNEDAEVAEGHGVCFDSPWAITVVSQRQFWDDWDYDIDGVVSICVSDWDSPGVVYGKAAKDCDPDEVKEEVWEQLNRHLDERIDDSVLVDYHLDPAVRDSDGNDEPLLINTCGSYEARPEPDTEIENLYIAADYARTETELATMESANEAARRAVNGILGRSSVSAPLCETYDFKELSVGPAERYDRIAERLNVPHVGKYTKRLHMAAAEVADRVG